MTVAATATNSRASPCASASSPVEVCGRIAKLIGRVESLREKWESCSLDLLLSEFYDASELLLCQDSVTVALIDALSTIDLSWPLQKKCSLIVEALASKGIRPTSGILSPSDQNSQQLYSSGGTASSGGEVVRGRLRTMSDCPPPPPPQQQDTDFAVPQLDLDELLLQPPPRLESVREAIYMDLAQKTNATRKQLDFIDAKRDLRPEWMVGPKFLNKIDAGAIHIEWNILGLQKALSTKKLDRVVSPRFILNPPSTCPELSSLLLMINFSIGAAPFNTLSCSLSLSIPARVEVRFRLFVQTTGGCTVSDWRWHTFGGEEDSSFPWATGEMTTVAEVPQIFTVGCVIDQVRTQVCRAAGGVLLESLPSLTDLIDFLGTEGGQAELRLPTTRTAYRQSPPPPKKLSSSSSSIDEDLLDVFLLGGGAPHTVSPRGALPSPA